MKKQVTIVGIQHKTGTGSRTQKPYDFWVMHCTYPDTSCEGCCALSINVPDSEVPNIRVGETVTLFSHFYNGREYYDAILQ